MAEANNESLFAMRLDVLDRILDGANLLRVFVGDDDLEGFFESEHELDEAELISAEVVDERRFRLDVLLVDVELFFDDALHLGGDVATLGHVSIPPNFPCRGAHCCPENVRPKVGKTEPLLTHFSLQSEPHPINIPPFTRSTSPVT